MRLKSKKYHILMEFSMTQEEVAQSVGKKAFFCSKCSALAEFRRKNQGMVADGSGRPCKVLLGVDSLSCGRCWRKGLLEKV